MPSTTSTAIVKQIGRPVRRLESNPLCSMHSDALGMYVRNELVGIATKLVHIRPYVEELWRRFENGETILGCSTKKQFCEEVLQRSPRAVRFMLAGGNPSNKLQTREEEIISPRTVHALKRIRAFGDFVLAALIEEQCRCFAADNPQMDMQAAILGARIELRMCYGDDWGLEEPQQSWSDQFVPLGTPDPCAPDCEFCIAFERDLLPEAKASRERRGWTSRLG
jgi:hypothetical protein